MDREEGLYGGRGDGGRLLVVQDLHQPMECFSDEVNSRNCGEEEEEANDGPSNGAAGGVDGPASVEAGAKRRRGRPPGSKNKPKPPPVVTRDVDPAAAMRLHMLEIPSDGARAAATSGSACSWGRPPSPTSHSATQDKQEPFCFLFTTLEGEACVVVFLICAQCTISHRFNILRSSSESLNI